MPKTTTTSRVKPSTKTRPKSKSKPNRPPRDPKQSHLYTDDNPTTTLHGTGFKDPATANQTLTLIRARSLTYQHQVVNTMYHRAKHHPSMRSSPPPAISAAMAIFRHWLDHTYPAAKQALHDSGHDFKPLLTRATVQKYLDRVDDEDAREFAGVYVALPKGKRLANVLVDGARPEGEDWEVRRERMLVELVERREGEGEEGLWSDKGGPSKWHLACIGWAWSPVEERRIP